MIVRRLLDSLKHLVYPPLCLHCTAPLANPEVLLCDPCTTLLEFIDPMERCRQCFAEASGVCLSCRQLPGVLTQAAAVFEYMGPGASLVRQLKYGNQPHLSKSIAAFMTAQFVKLDWPIPDLIIPVPMPRLKQWCRGYNQSELLAQELAILLSCSHGNALTRRSGDFSQAGLTLQQRRNLSGSNIRLKGDRSHMLADKTLLLVDDVMTSGSTFRRCAEALMEACPAAIYALAVCRAVKSGIAGGRREL